MQRNLGLKATASILFILASCPPTFASVSQTLEHFSVQSTSRLYSLSAVASVGSMSQLSDILAAANVTVSIKNNVAQTTKAYDCRSFAFHIGSAYASCETARKTFIFDIKNSTIQSF